MHTREKFINHQENILQLCTQHTQYCTLYNMYTAVFSMGSYHRVEWFTTFMRFSKMDTFCRSGIFLWVPSKKLGKFCRSRSEVFNFQKITGTLELMFFLLLTNIFLLNQWTPAKNKNRNLKTFQNFILVLGQKDICLGQRKHISFIYLHF